MGVIDLKNKPMKLCVTYKIKLYVHVYDLIVSILFLKINSVNINFYLKT